MKFQYHASLIALLLGLPLAAQETPEVEVLDPPLSAQEPLRKADADEVSEKKKKIEDEPIEDRLESQLEKAGEFYQNRQRAKCGGALLEAAETLEELAGNDVRQVSVEAEHLRELALDAARGKLDAREVDLAAAGACQRLSAIFHQRSKAAWTAGKPKDAGRAWYRSTAFLQRSVDWGGFGLTQTGIDTLDQSAALAENLATGEPADSDAVRKLSTQSESMISWVGHSIAEKMGVEREDELSENEEGSGEFVQDKIVRKVKRGAIRLGEILELLGEPNSEK